MHIDIHSQGFTLTPGLREYVRKRLAYALSHGDGSVMRLTVRLSDVNGPRGGDDKRCLIEARLKQAPAVVVEDVEADLYVAIDRAAGRAGRALARRLARGRQFAPAPELEGIPEPSGWQVEQALLERGTSGRRPG